MTRKTSVPTNLPLSELLARAGFHLRMRIRADCAYRTGRSRSTVSYTAEVAYCHRCEWRASRVLLGRELGLSNGKRSLSPVEQTQRRRKAEQHKQHLAEIAEFEQWRNETYYQAAERYAALSRAAALAAEVLHNMGIEKANECATAECEKAWAELAEFVHQQRGLEQARDFLMCRKASPYLEHDITSVEMFELWRRR